MRASTLQRTAAATQCVGPADGHDAPPDRELAFAPALAAVALVALVTRVLVVWWIPTQPVSDFWSYISLAEQLIEEGRYGWWHGSDTAYLAPGYPLLLAAVFSVTGSSLLVTKIVNLVLSTAMVVLGGLAARVLLGSVAGIAAAALLAVDPRQLLLTGLAASENLGAPALFGFLWMLGLSWRRERGLSVAAVGGLLLGVSALARPVGLMAWLLWPACGLLVRKPLWRVAQETLLLLVALYAVLLPWGIRNHITLGRYTTSTTTAGINFFMGNNDAASGSWIEWRPVLAAIRPETGVLEEGPVDRIAAEEARRWIVAHPVRAAKLYLYKLYRYFFWPDFTSVAEWAIHLEQVLPPNPPVDVLPGPHVLKRQPWIAAVALVGSLSTIVLLAIVGAASLLRRALREGGRRASVARPAALALLGLTIYYPLVTAVFIVVDRYRWPLEDVLTLLAGAGIASVLGWSGNHRRPTISRPVRAARQDRGLRA